jgi:hypothetical protein
VNCGWAYWATTNYCCESLKLTYLFNFDRDTIDIRYGFNKIKLRPINLLDIRFIPTDPYT